MIAPHTNWCLPDEVMYILWVWSRHCLRKAIAVVNFIIIVRLDVMLKKDFACGFATSPAF